MLNALVSVSAYSMEEITEEITLKKETVDDIEIISRKSTKNM